MFLADERYAEHLEEKEEKYLTVRQFKTLCGFVTRTCFLYFTSVTKFYKIKNLLHMTPWKASESSHTFCMSIKKFSHKYMLP